MTFEDDVARLEAIAAELDTEGVTLDHALKLFQEGVTRLRRASAELARVEAQVTMLVEQVEGSFTLRPLRDGGGVGGVGSGASSPDAGGRP